MSYSDKQGKGLTLKSKVTSKTHVKVLPLTSWHEVAHEVALTWQIVVIIGFYDNLTRSVNLNHGAKIQWLLPFDTYSLHWAKCTNSPSCSNLFVCCELQVHLICYHCLGGVGTFTIFSCIAKLLPLLAQCYSFWYRLLFNSVHLCCLKGTTKMTTTLCLPFREYPHLTHL